MRGHGRYLWGGHARPKGQQVQRAGGWDRLALVYGCRRVGDGGDGSWGQRGGRGQQRLRASGGRGRAHSCNNSGKPLKGPPWGGGMIWSSFSKDGSGCFLRTDWVGVQEWKQRQIRRALEMGVREDTDLDGRVAAERRPGMHFGVELTIFATSRKAG